MKLLLDECIDRRLARDLPEHAVRTVPQMGWAGVDDRDLLRLAEQEFDGLITVDQNLPSQQNLALFDLAVVILQARSNRLADLQCFVPKILEALPNAPKGRATVISLE